MLAFLPAWLVSFTALLEDRPGARPEVLPAISWILSAAAALMGAIATEARVREANAAPPASWRQGLLVFGPAWAIALVAHLARVALFA